MITQPPTDKELEEYLKGDSKLSQLYRVSQDANPPQTLDRSILRAAHKAVQKKSFWSFFQFSQPGALVPATGFAVLALVTFSVLILYKPATPDTTANRSAPNTGHPKPNTSTPTNEGIQWVKSRKSKEGDAERPETQPNRVDPTEKTRRDAIAENLKTNPALWWEHILDLNKRKQLEEAKFHYRYFMELYPKHPVKKETHEELSR